jgi:hypothetical protein
MKHIENTALYTVHKITDKYGSFRCYFGLLTGIFGEVTDNCIDKYDSLF